MKVKNLFALALVFASVSAPAYAHPGHATHLGFMSGFIHPFSGIDHVIAMVAVGAYAAQLGGANLWRLPMAFMVVMMFGGLLGYSGVQLPMVEQAIGLSVVVMSIAVGAGWRLPGPAAACLVGAFALFHGQAHGAEASRDSSFAAYALGFVAATAALHVAGLAAGLGFNELQGRPAAWLRGAVGMCGAAAGIALLTGAL